MSKAIKISLIILIPLVLVAYFLVPRMILRMITDYDPFTFEYVLNDPYLVSEYGIHDNNIPEDYGFESEEIS